MKPINETDLEQLSAYIDGELSDSERRFFQKRLSSDAELRACCERVWIASTVLKSQPFQLMPANSAELIGSKCDDKRGYFKMPMRLVASIGALTIVAGIGFQFMRTSEPTGMVAQTADATASSAPALVVQAPSSIQSSPDAADAQPIVAMPGSGAAASTGVNSGKSVAQSDPSQFELNENTRSKSWPRSTQGMDDYLARHNQLVDANANNGLVSYVQLITDEQPLEPRPATQEQDSQ